MTWRLALLLGGPALSAHALSMQTRALGLIPLALAQEAGSEQDAPLARAISSGLSPSFLVTLFLVPAAYFLMHRNEEPEFIENSQETPAT